MCVCVCALPVALGAESTPKVCVRMCVCMCICILLRVCVLCVTLNATDTMCARMCVCAYVCVPACVTVNTTGMTEACKCVCACAVQSLRRVGTCACALWSIASSMLGCAPVGQHVPLLLSLPCSRRCAVCSDLSLLLVNETTISTSATPRLSITHKQLCGTCMDARAHTNTHTHTTRLQHCFAWPSRPSPLRCLTLLRPLPLFSPFNSHAPDPAGRGCHAVCPGGQGQEHPDRGGLPRQGEQARGAWCSMCTGTLQAHTC